MRCSRAARRVMGVASLAAAWLAVAAPQNAKADPLDEASEAITELEIDRARRLLEPLSPRDPQVALQLARLAMISGDCEQAVRDASPPDVMALPDAPPLLAVALGCARAMAGTVTEMDESRHVLIRFQDDEDRPLLPWIVETLEKHRAVLARDLGVEMPLPIRVDVVRDQFTLAAMTGLPHQAAQTTGTVAVAKFGRVILLSPRAPTLGFPWRDTLAHELTHLALSRGTLDRAPLWLQEGVAKREETRWRAPLPTDDRISVDAVAAAGLVRGLGRPLDGIGPSIAMLPSAREAMVVFAEVTSFVHFLSGDRAGARGAPTEGDVLARLVTAFRGGNDADAALRAVTNRDLKGWNHIWRPWVATQAKRLPSALGLDADAPPFDPDLQRATRIGELLLARDHVKLARARLDTLVTATKGDPFVWTLIARARLRDGDVDAASKVTGDPAVMTGDLGAWWAVRADVLRALPGDATNADAAGQAYGVAAGHTPFAVEVSCAWADAYPTDDPAGIFARGLCHAARALNRPPFGHD